MCRERVNLGVECVDILNVECVECVDILVSSVSTYWCRVCRHIECGCTRIVLVVLVVIDVRVLLLLL